MAALYFIVFLPLGGKWWRVCTCVLFYFSLDSFCERVFFIGCWCSSVEIINFIKLLEPVPTCLLVAVNKHILLWSELFYQLDVDQLID